MVLLRWLLDPWMGERYPFITVFGAVAAAVWYGGWCPAMVATVFGLAASEYLFIEPHGVQARSDGNEKGSEFTVRLPLVRAPAGEPATSDESEKVRPVRKFRILVVDDMRDAADSLTLILRMMGHDVITAYDGLEAVQAAAAFRPDVALLDIGLPKMNGYEAARRIREEPGGDKIALIALTGWGQDEDKRRAREAGFTHHLTKPVEPAGLESLLARIAERN